MPELAEVEFYRRRWHEVAAGRRITVVQTHDHKKTYRSAPAAPLRNALTGARLLDSATAAKQMLFRFSGGAWLGVHLGMSGELTVHPVNYIQGKHDHLVLRTSRHTLVFSDPRMFGKLEFARGPDAPAWWTRIAPALLSKEFTADTVAAFLRRRAKAPIKAVLLMQERFPGIGNWMADEILWRAALHPRRAAGSLTPAETRVLRRECRQVARQALRAIAGQGGPLPPDLNVNIPNTWLFNHRWTDGGLCPRTHVPLIREEIGGRTTCWSPGRQRLKS
jgi:formamidopyrimidine-DNA glycosylase